MCWHYLVIKLFLSNFLYLTSKIKKIVLVELHVYFYQTFLNTFVNKLFLRFYSFSKFILIEVNHRCHAPFLWSHNTYYCDLTKFYVKPHFCKYTSNQNNNVPTFRGGAYIKHFHITIFVVLNYGREKSTLNVLVVVKSLDWYIHIVVIIFYI